MRNGLREACLTLAMATQGAVLDAASTHAPTEARAYIFDRCIASEESAAPAEVGTLASIFLPNVVTTAFNSFGTWLTNLGKAQTTSYSASQKLDLYVLSNNVLGTTPVWNDKVRCILFIRGEFSNSYVGTPRNARITDAFPIPLSEANLVARLHENDIDLNGPPDLVFEGRLIPSADGSAVYMKTEYLEIAKFQSSSHADETRGLAVTTVIDAPTVTKDVNPSTVASFILNFGDQRTGGGLLNKDLKKGQESVWVTMPGMSAGSQAALKAMQDYSSQLTGAIAAAQAPQAQATAAKNQQDADILGKRITSLTDAQAKQSKLATNLQLTPVNVTVTVAETESEKKWLEFIGSVFASSQADLVKQVSAQVSPAQREAASASTAAAAANTQSALDSAESAYWAAKYDLEIANAALKAAPSDLTKQKNAKLALLTYASAVRKYNQLLQSSGLPTVS